VIDRFCPDDQKAHIAELRRTLDIDFICSDVMALIKESSDGANRVKQIVMDLKDFAQVDEAQIKDNDINQCVRRTLNVIKHELRMVTRIELQLTELQLIPFNAQQINQLLTSLLLNAAQAIEGEGEITIKTWQEQPYAMLSVTDTGSGIAPEIAKRIFEPFFTTKIVGNGTGLGLTVAYDIVRKHEGELRLESEPGKGSTFTVCLPLQRQVGEV
jgi:signal transduction histidine kinase